MHAASRKAGANTAVGEEPAPASVIFHLSLCNVRGKEERGTNINGG